MVRTLKNKERELFLNIMLPDIKGKASEEAKGRLLYAMKTEKLTDNDLASVFPDNYHDVMDFYDTKSRFSLFSKPQYILEFFFMIHNKKDKTKVIPAKIVGFKAERIGGKQIMTARVKYYDGKLEESSLEVFENIEIKDINLQKNVLVHNKTVCHIINEKEYNNIINKYFN